MELVQWMLCSCNSIDDHLIIFAAARRQEAITSCIKTVCPTTFCLFLPSRMSSNAVTHGTRRDVYIKEISALIAEEILCSLFGNLLGFLLCLCVCPLWTGLLANCSTCLCREFTLIITACVSFSRLHCIYYNSPSQKTREMTQSDVRTRHYLYLLV